jgi:integrase
LDRAVWHIPAERRKGKEGRRRPLDVPLSPLAVRLLRDLHVMTSKRERLFRLGLGLIGGEVQDAIGLPDVTIHDLRQSCSSGIQRLGAART